MKDSSGQPRSQSSTLSLTNLLLSLGVDIQCQMHNAGNDAFMTLLALQLLLDPHNTKIPVTRAIPMPPPMLIPRAASRSPGPGVPMIAVSPSIPGLSPWMPAGFASPALSSSPDPDVVTSRRSSGYFPPAQPLASSMNGRRRMGSGLSPNMGGGDVRRTVSDQEVSLRMGSMRLK